MKRSGICPKCGSPEIAMDAKVIDRGESETERDMHVAVLSKPTGTPFEGKHESSVSAWICTSCGFVELYADRPGELKPETNPFLRTISATKRRVSPPKNG